jgi:hypothetical protein
MAPIFRAHVFQFCDHLTSILNSEEPEMATLRKWMALSTALKVRRISDG